jgi:hypothetical protein
MSWQGRAPWPTATTAVVIGALVSLVCALPWGEAVLPLVGRIAELALAGAAAYLVDDAAAALTTVVPRGTWRRRAPVLAVGTALLGSAWAVILLALGSRDVRPPILASTGELLVLALVALAVAVALVRRGDPEPGARVAPAVVLLGLGLLTLESVLRHPLLVPWDGAAGTRMLATWTGVGLVALAVSVWASRDPAGTVPTKPLILAKVRRMLG